MLNYLWETYGTYIWNHKHFYIVMNFIIESEWLEGIQILMRNKTTHNMLKALSSQERC